MSTKAQLIQKVASVRFSGKSKTVFIDSNRLDYPATQYLTQFCLLSNYKYKVV